MPLIKLNMQQVEFCESVARSRVQTEPEKAALGAPEGGDVKLDLEGVLGEFAAAVYLKLGFERDRDPTTGDLDYGIEVRSTMADRGFRLRVSVPEALRDKGATPFVLCRIHKTDEIEVAGWAFGAESALYGDWCSLNGGSGVGYWIHKENLRPMHTLFDWIEQQERYRQLCNR